LRTVIAATLSYGACKLVNQRVYRALHVQTSGVPIPEYQQAVASQNIAAQ
jgi:hypothetical protein